MTKKEYLLIQLSIEKAKKAEASNENRRTKDTDSLVISHNFYLIHSAAVSEIERQLAELEEGEKG